MAGSQYAYVRNFELPDPVLPNTYMVVRVDGKGFHKFSEKHGFVKPNDARALELMNAAARFVVESLRPDVTLAFGESDEFSFLLRRECTLYKRRQSKLVTHIVSLFTSAYVFHWPQFLPNVPLQEPPSFDGRLVPYPGEKEVRDYFAWRQADTHINNLYNTTFWALVLQGGMSEHEAHKLLEGTVSSQKNEILFDRFGINYSKLPALFRKGTTIAWDERDEGAGDKSGERPSRRPTRHQYARVLHVDIIGAAFWIAPKHGQDADTKSGSTTNCKDTPRTSSLIDPKDSSLDPWEQSDRLHRADGLGFRALR